PTFIAPAGWDPAPGREPSPALHRDMIDGGSTGDRYERAAPDDGGWHVTAGRASEPPYRARAVAPRRRWTIITVGTAGMLALLACWTRRTAPEAQPSPAQRHLRGVIGAGSSVRGHLVLGRSCGAAGV